jgi:RecA/RadA recombinase
LGVFSCLAVSSWRSGKRATALGIEHRAQSGVSDRPPWHLAANLCGGLLMGAAVEVFGVHANAPPEARWPS